jgi:tRNA-uridine 2-sulfurtransferase
MTNNLRVVVAMSGGVDSSVAAALLVQQGYEVIGIMLRLWSEPGKETTNRCCTPDSMAMARRVAARLGIPFYAIDAQEAFHKIVVQSFIDGYMKGDTPNPCILCNRLIRWDFLFKRALSLGADFLATGHYARIYRIDQERFKLLRAIDDSKDQSYVLHVLDQSHLRHALFPLGEFTKPQIRQLARDFDLPVAERPDSQDLCFIGGENYRDFLTRNVDHAARPGPIFDSQGNLLGQHKGLALYTIGQRKGLGISSPAPLYVIHKDIIQNALIVGAEEELGQQALTVRDVNWIAGEPPATQFRSQIKIRYKAHLAWGNVSVHDNDVHVVFDAPLRDITPGQAAVFFDGELCLGGGTIQG